MTSAPVAEPAAVGERRETVDAVVVGAGFAGLYAVHTLRGQGLRVRGVEAGSDVGGTWFWNRYPGARCDAVSALYSYSFDEDLQQEWTWSEKYATQPEILAYLRHVADRFALRDDFWFDTRVASAHWDETSRAWTVRTDTGDEVVAAVVVMATGCLSQARVPDIPGLAQSSLPVFHTGNWPHDGVDFTGQRVGVIGTGSSGIQLIPQVAEAAEHVTVFQRTPSFTVPAHNAPNDPAADAALKAQYPEIRAAWRRGELVGAGEELRPGNSFRRTVMTFDVEPEDREREYGKRWSHGGPYFSGAFADFLLDERANEVGADFIRDRIAETVTDPVTAEKLTPRGFPAGAKRLCVDTDYYETFNRDDVDLVDVREDPIERVTDVGIVTRSGEHRVDALVCATGFDAMTGALLAMDIRGRDDRSLADVWSEGPRAYLGLAVHGFPNLFLVTGPGSPSVLGNVVGHIEQHVEYIGDLLADSRERGVSVVEAELEPQLEWALRVNQNAAATLYPTANSWYLGANVPGKPRVFMPFVGGIGLYRQLCDDVKADGYRGFARTS